VDVVRLHLDPERKGESFTSLPPVVTLRSLPGEAPRSTRATLRWTGADTLALEVPLGGTETALTTVDVPGYGPMALPPVCLPYSPEFNPDHGERGLQTLEKLSRATGGKERLEPAGIWQDMPRHLRFVPMTRWLLAAVLVLLLLEVLERRTGLLRVPRRRAGGLPAPHQPDAPARDPHKPGAPATGTGAEEKRETPAASPALTEQAGVVEAMRKARKRLQGRTD
jgi:hypothetical protein